MIDRGAQADRSLLGATPRGLPGAGRHRPV